MKRVHPSPEPILKDAPRYCVVLHPTKRCARYRYAQNRAQVREIKRTQKPGTYIEVFKIDHNFTQAWLA